MPYQLPLSDGQVLTVPTSWADVTLATFVALLAPTEGDQRTAAELLLGLEAGSLNQLAYMDVPLIANLIEFTKDTSPVLELLPTPGLPDIGMLPYGLIRAVQLRMEECEGRPWLSYGPYLLALCRCFLMWGKAYEGKVAACEAALLAAPSTEVYADMAFFLTSYRRSLTAMPPTPKTPLSPKTPKWMQAMNTWKTALGRFLASMRWRRATS